MTGKTMTGRTMTGKTCIVTGANAGIGREIARGLSRRGATVVLVCRDQNRGEAALKDIAKSTGNDSIFLSRVDLASQDSIRRFGRDFTDRFESLDILARQLWEQSEELIDRSR